jgi:FkbM family methyltransferase
MVLEPTPYQHALALITRRYPFLSGAASIPNSRFFSRISGPQNVEGWSQTPGGEIYARLNDFIGRAVFFSGDLDPKLTSVARRLIRKDDIVFDIGANIGVMTLQFSDLAGPSGQVSAFEPNPEAMKLLRAATNRKRATNVVLNEIAFGREPDVLTLTCPQGNVGAGTLRGVTGRAGWSDANTYQVNVVRLDDYIVTKKIKKVDVIKIDVEEAEADVFEGAEDLLRNNPPRAIIFEDNDRDENAISPAIRKLMEFGYGFIALPKKMLKLKPIKIDPTKERIVAHDFIATKLGSGFQSLCGDLGVE